MENSYRDDIKRHFKVIDMMLTAHSVLRDKNNIYSKISDVLLFIFAVILNSVVLIDVFNLLQIDDKIVSILIGGSSVFLLILSLVSLLMGWKEKALKHNHATILLSDLKLRCRELRIEPDPSLEYIKREIDLYNNCLNSLPIKIPEREFLKLKAYHQRKIMLSKKISQYPGSSIFLIRIVLWFEGNLELLKCFKERGGGD
ncbi:MAG: hypothetical protein APF76_18245 [Desulfitibacter sp. BRH_c19]|nr:MAG: hypothetical protein APF76_18245 [Desulfitibacter sp. BRH_c19]